MERYSRQIREGSPPGIYIHGVQMNSTFNEGTVLSLIGESIGKLGEYERRKQDEWNTATVMNAQVEYDREMTEYMRNPETGILNRKKLGEARGISEQTYKYAEEIAEKISLELENENQRKAFKKIADRSRLPYWKQASEYEAQELKKYKEQAFKGNLEASKNMMLNNPYDKYTIKSARDQIRNVIRAQYYGSPEELVEQVIKDTLSDMDASRVGMISETDPKKALEMLEEEDLKMKPEIAAKFRGSLSKEVERIEEKERQKSEIYEVQLIVDELIKQYPQRTEKQLYTLVRKEYSGRQEERIISALKTRIEENKLERDNTEREKREQQERNWDRVLKDYVSSGKLPTSEEVKRMVIEEEILPQRGIELERMRKEALTKTEIRQKLERTPGWYKLTPQQQWEKIASELGITQEQ